MNLASTPAFARMFLFYFNKLGCVGSLLISAAVTVMLLFAFGIFGSWESNPHEPGIGRGPAVKTSER